MGAQSSKSLGEDAETRGLSPAISEERKNLEQRKQDDVADDRNDDDEEDEDEDDEEEEDEWDKRIFSTGCAEENDRMRDCHFEKKDWRLCIEEMEQFKRCWKAHGNEERTGQKNR